MRWKRKVDSRRSLDLVLINLSNIIININIEENNVVYFVRTLSTIILTNPSLYEC